MKKGLLIIIALLLVAALSLLVSGVVTINKKSPQPATTETLVQVNETDPFKGATAAKVVIIEFSSFSCPSCQRSASALGQLLALYPNELKLVWKDLPHDLELSRAAAMAARCAQLQGQFWAYHDLLFSHQSDLSADLLTQAADQLSLDRTAFDRCLSTNQTLPLVEQNIQEALDHKIDAVPYFDVNGQGYSGELSLGRWRQVLEELK